MLKILGKIFFLFAIFATFSLKILFSQDKTNIPDEEIALLERARRVPASENWAKLSGKITHRKKDSQTAEHCIYLGIRFTPQMIFAQILIDNIESYTVSQGFASKQPTIIKEGATDSRIMEKIGLRPEELTLSFLYWNPERFIGDKTFKSSKCAEIEMRCPVSNERTVLLISREYAFPLKVEWFKNDENTPIRTMEVSSFKKENNYWFVDEILLYGPGWRSKVIFSDTEAGSASDGLPEDLFRKAHSPKTP